MRRLKLMRRGLVVAALLLVLTLLPTAPMAAGKKEDKHPGPPPKEGPYIVSFGGDLETGDDEPVNLTVMKYGGLTVYYGYANITFQERGTREDGDERYVDVEHSIMYDWDFFQARSDKNNWVSDFEDSDKGFLDKFPERNDFGKVWITVDTRSGETWFYYDFDRYLYGETADRYVGYVKYELSGLFPSGTTFNPEAANTRVYGEFEIVQMFYYATSNGKKSATSVVYDWRWSGNLEFTVSPTPPST